MTQNNLDINNLSIAFRSGKGLQTVVSNVNLQLNKGETLALVGESGSGKSVLAKSILKILPEHAAVYTTGSISYAGEPVLAMNDKRLSQLRGEQVGMIFQEPMSSLNPLHSVEKQLAEVLYLHKGWNTKQSRSTVLDWLHKVGITDPESKLKSLPHELSGGERQRVMIAMALLAEPDILIADEPTTALDVTIQQQILDLLAKLQVELNMAMIFITHDLNIVRRISTRVAVMRLGEIVEQGNTEEVFDQPKHEYTKMLLDSEPAGVPNPVASDAPQILDVENLKVWFPVKAGILKRVVDHVKAVDDISFSIRSGETLGIVGESGSGKTTLGHAILKLTNSEGGVSYSLGADEARQALSSFDKKALKAFRRRCQIIFQDPFASLSPRMSVRDIIAEGLEIHEKVSTAEIDQRVIEVMESVQLDPKVRYRYPNEFSGGQRQRIAIARALILKPVLLILDEPTSALDRSVQKEIIELLKHLQDEFQLSYIFISHDLNVVKAMSHKILVMRRGKLVESGHAEQIFTKPKEAYTRELLEAAFGARAMVV